jgi:predicted transcriptional regulator
LVFVNSFEECVLGSSYRGRLDIVADILNVVSRKPKKTQIMYQANLSFRVLQKYLTEVGDASLIFFEDESQCYVLTAKGEEFLSAYKQYSITNRQAEKIMDKVISKKQSLEKLFNQ